MAPPRIGRPPIPSEARRSTILPIRLTEDEAQSLREYAARRGVMLSTWLRKLALSVARRPQR